MDNLLPLIVLIIVVVSAITKAKAKAKPKAKIKAAPGELQQKLKAFFADIQEKLEAQSRKPTSGASQWGQMARERMTDVSTSDTYEMSLEDLVLEEEEEVTESAEEKPLLRPAGVQARPAEKQPADERPDLRVQEPAHTGAALGLASLRRAIVWSEILGPPVALRQFTGDR